MSATLPKTQQDISQFNGYILLAIIAGFLGAWVMIPDNFIIWLVIGIVVMPSVIFLRHVKIKQMKANLGNPSQEEWRAFVASLPASEKAREEERVRREAQAAARELAAHQARVQETARRLLALPEYELKPAGAFANVEVVGEAYREQSGVAALGGLPVDREKEINITAYLVPEAGNPHDSNAIMVWMNSQHVGYLSRGDATRYRPAIEKIFNGGYLPATSGRLWGVTRRDSRSETGLRHHIYARVALDDPHLIRLPTNNPPLAPYSLLPWGSAIQATKEADFLPELTEHLHGEESFAIATLQKASRTLKNGSEREYLVVMIDGDQIGELTPATSAKLMPAVDHLASMDLETAVWAKVKGTPLAIEVTLHAAKAHE